MPVLVVDDSRTMARLESDPTKLKHIRRF
jgi:hypothetical protein